MATNQRKCCNCSNDAVVVFGNDPDLTGIPSCNDCKQKVRLALILMLTNHIDFDKALKFINGNRKNKKRV